MKEWQDKRMNGLMEETVNKAIFITVPLNQTAAQGPAEHSGVSHSATYAGEGCLHMSILV